MRRPQRALMWPENRGGGTGRFRTADLEEGTTASRQSFRQGDWLELAACGRIGLPIVGIQLENSRGMGKSAQPAFAGFHFGTQLRITQRHLPAPTVR